uniref:Uncharacterized protein n=1 Tax=viral metagenome TaxID=1070528 RepID=A0A6C0KCY8_9ZZZZ
MQPSTSSKHHASALFPTPKKLSGTFFDSKREVCKLVLLVYLAYLIELLLLDPPSRETGGE